MAVDIYSVFEDLTDELESVSPTVFSETTFYANSDEKVDIKFRKQSFSWYLSFALILSQAFGSLAL